MKSLFVLFFPGFFTAVLLFAYFKYKKADKSTLYGYPILSIISPLIASAIFFYKKLPLQDKKVLPLFLTAFYWFLLLIIWVGATSPFIEPVKETPAEKPKPILAKSVDPKILLKELNNFKEEALLRAKYCDDKATKVFDVLKQGNPYSAYEYVSDAKERCETASASLSDLDTPTSFTDSKHKKSLEDFKYTLQMAYIARRRSLDEVLSFLDDPKPSRMGAIKQANSDYTARIIASGIELATIQEAIEKDINPKPKP